MHSAIKKILPALLFVFITGISKAADTVQAPLRVAILLPLNLDSAFNGYEYKLSNVRISQYFLSGLDFYSGVMMAIDSLQKENANIEVWIYDTHKASQSIEQLIVQMQPMNFSLIVASISNSTEQRALTSFSAKNSIPVISATFPNDIYLENNPFFIMVNPTWKTHIQAVYNYLAGNYRGKKIVFFTRRGSLEDRIAEEFKTLNTRRTLNFSTVILRDNFSAADVLSHLDSTTQNIILCGSLYEGFGQALIKVLNDNGETYSSTVAGMPTWNGMDGTTGLASDKIQIVITTPYNYVRGGAFIDSISANYMRAYYSKPSDMVYKGYETIYHFVKLLLANPASFINNVSRNEYRVSNDYNFEPVRLTQTSFLPDYLENKKLYYIKIINGRITIN
ncbi:ABC transporter substrate-binding protein [Parafilimonas sp.]|uniref:ABC transporter substrate-binding protein n=1 Tax=Parafilimonas sp. TaxID=1969739 RepID=UPI003F7CD77C